MRNSKRISYLGLLKFLAAIAIIFYHSKTELTSHGGAIYTLVEFFALITGYFTFRHFHIKKEEIKRDSIEKKSAKAFAYSMAKMLGLMPYVIISVIAILLIYMWYARQQGLYVIMMLFKTVPADMMLFHSQIPDSYTALWYVSALAIVMPLFCLICQTRKPKTILIVMMPFILVYFWSANWGNKIYGIWSIVRILSMLVSGMSIYYFSRYIKKYFVSKKTRLILQVVETMLLIAIFIMMYPVAEAEYTYYTDRYIVICIYVMLGILFSQTTYTSRLRNAFFDYLEQISMPLFLVHIPVMPMMALFITPHEKPLCYVVATITASVILSMVVTFGVGRIKKLSRKNEHI